MNLRQWDSIRDHRLPKHLVFIRNDMRGVEKQKLRETGKRTAPVVSSDDGFAERCLMQTLFDRAQGVSPLADPKSLELGRS